MLVRPLAGCCRDRPPMELIGGCIGEDGFVLRIALPLTAGGGWVLMGGTYALATPFPGRLAYAAPVISLSPCLLVIWTVTAWSFHQSAGAGCPTGQATWWPSWLPL